MEYTIKIPAHSADILKAGLEALMRDASIMHQLVGMQIAQQQAAMSATAAPPESPYPNQTPEVGNE